MSKPLTEAEIAAAWEGVVDACRIFAQTLAEMVRQAENAAVVDACRIFAQTLAEMVRPIIDAMLADLRAARPRTIARTSDHYHVGSTSDPGALLECAKALDADDFPRHVEMDLPDPVMEFFKASAHTIKDGPRP